MPREYRRKRRPAPTAPEAPATPAKPSVPPPAPDDELTREAREHRADLARERAAQLDEQRWLAQQAAAEAEVRRQILAELPIPATVGDQRKMAELLAGMPLPVLLVELALRSDRMGKRAEAIKAIDAAAAYLYPTMKAVEMRLEGATGPQVPQLVIEMPPPSDDELAQARPFG